MKITVVGFPGIPQRVVDMVEAASNVLVSEGFDVSHVDVPALGLPESISAEDLETWNAFTLTPGALIESWRISRHLDTLIPAGERVLIVDHLGKGGVFALEQAMRGSDAAWEVWTLAGASTVLSELDTFGVATGVDDESTAAIDWELVQYRHSTRVLTLSDRAKALLSTIDVDGDPLSLPARVAPPGHAVAGEHIAVPEPVGRRSHTPEIMRAVVGALVDDPSLSVSVTADDHDDLVWLGTTWRTIPIPNAVVERIRRTNDLQANASIVILGDPFAVPSPLVSAAYERGARLLVPHESVAASVMPQARTWASEEQLAELIRSSESAVHHRDPARPLDTLIPDTRHDRSRATRVSVGIPVYADTRFLEACVASIVEQTQAPHEVILFDDGSHAREVTDTLNEIASLHPSLVRVMEGPNRGVCAARNEMIASMTGDAVVLVDSDDTLHTDFIATCAQALRANPDVSAVATWTEFFGGYNGIEAKPPFTARVGLRENPIVSTAVLIDMTVIEDGVSFADDLAFLYCEDWHVWSQIIAADGRFGLIPRPLVRHRVHGSSGAARRTELAHRIGKHRATEPLIGGWPR